jgi:outer membrane protein assembly factor BamB
MLRWLAIQSLLVGLIAIVGEARGENWPGWRGPRGDGVSQEKDLPTAWNGETGANICWKVKIPGEGHSSPVVWEDRLFLGTCLPDTLERVLLCLDRRSGKELWRRTVVRCPLETKHTLNSQASGTPATDGELVYIAFLEVDGHTIPAPNVGEPRPITPGQIVVAAFDLDGHPKWQVKAGEFISAHGFCSNPVLFEDLVIINGDHDGDSYLVALDRASGKVRWRVKRDHGIRSYVTPIIRELDGRTQMVLSGSQHVASYDPRTGERHWTMDGPTEQFVASMVCDGERLFVTGGFPEYHIVAIRPDGRGNVTDTHVVWRTQRGASYVTSPIVVGPYLLVVSDGGVASCFDSASGERHWMERLGGGFGASPVAADGLVYAISSKGVTSVLRLGTEFEKIAENKLGEDCSSSPAISQGCLFIRGHEYLFCIGKM